MKLTFLSGKSIVKRERAVQERGKRKNSGLRKHKQLFEEFEVCRIGHFYGLLKFPESFSQLLIH